MSTKLFKEFLLIKCMVLTEILVGKRDEREEEIEDLLKQTLEEWENNSLNGKSYLNKAIKLKSDIEREKGKVYFEKYPEISKRVGKVINKLLEYET